MKNYIFKLMNLFKVFIKAYCNPTLRIETIDVSRDRKETLVHIIIINTNQKIIKDIETLYNQKRFLVKFSNRDAAQIGYYYGRNAAHN